MSCEAGESSKSERLGGANYSMPRRQAPPPKELQVSVFRRDHWLCRLSERPVIFAPAMKYFEREVRNAGYNGKLAYFHPNFTRNGAPLLDALAAVIDHVEALARGGSGGIDDLVTACNKCNMRKSDLSMDDYRKKEPKPKPIRGKYGEAVDWDGFSSLFVILAERYPKELTDTEREWLKLFKPPSIPLR
jgi:5-methylcytosine-specific restriction endonuclease McrA